MTIKQLFSSKATKKNERAARMQMSLGMPKLLQRDTLLGQRHTESQTVVVYALTRAYTHSQLHICSHVQLGYTPYYVVQGFSRVSNGFAVTTFLLEFAS